MALEDDKRHRIVSLIPSASEILCMLGLESRMVGRSHQCDFPPGLAHLPACSSTQIDCSASSRIIDVKVRTRLLKALSIYQVDISLRGWRD